jgi:hypothetical protein
MPTIILSKKDISTVSRIVAEKAMEMHKKGAMWHRGEEMLSCVDIGKIANKVSKPLGSRYDFDSVFKKK